VSIQDYGAQLAGHLIDLKKGHKVLDLCAAPGGKTCHMLELEQIELTAVDLNKKRVEMIKDNLGRSDLKAKVINAKVDISNKWWDGEQFDRIMLDAPCTASGIVRRHIDIKWLRRESDLEFFSNQQFELLDASWTMLKDKGKLLYVTCSIFREENRSVIDKFKKINNVEEIEIKFPSNVISIESQLIPNDNHDGLFYALLKK
jgi:16S rRNA (cytosine967-C5)-methyltransferase